MTRVSKLSGLVELHLSPSELHGRKFSSTGTRYLTHTGRCRKTSKKRQKLLILLFLIRFVRRPVIIPLGAIKSDTHLMPHPGMWNDDESR